MNIVKQLKFTDEAKDKSIKYKIKFNKALEAIKECRIAQRELNSWINTYKEKITNGQLEQLNDIINHIDNNNAQQRDEALDVIINCPHYTATCVIQNYFTLEHIGNRTEPLPFYHYICDACGEKIKMDEYETLAKNKKYLKNE